VGAVDYRAFLRTVHARLAPSTYLEIGIRHGGSLSIAKCRAIGIDPAFSITAEIDGDIALFRTSSDEYFSRAEPLTTTGGRPFDLVFIDGLHLMEFALRDLINAERHASPSSLIIFDDVLPRDIDEAARVRHTTAWTGDVYAILEVLAEYRPDLVVVPVGTTPTGLLLLTGLDPDNTTLSDNYDAILRRYRRADPQPVPAGVLDRLTVLPPARVFASSVLDLLRQAKADGTTAAELRPRLAEAVAQELGTAFAPAASRS
jgi:hypothetical protein